MVLGLANPWGFLDLRILEFQGILQHSWYNINQVFQILELFFKKYFISSIIFIEIEAMEKQCI